MQTQSTLKPGQRGTKKLVERYGDRLICVRYRIDRETGKRLKTVELIVDETEPATQHPARQPKQSATPTHVFIHISAHDVNLQQRVKAKGAWFNAKKNLWRLPYNEVQAMGLEASIVPENGTPGW